MGRKRSNLSKMRSLERQKEKRTISMLSRPKQNQQVFGYLKDKTSVKTLSKIAIDENNTYWINNRLDKPTGTNNTYYADNGWRKVGDGSLEDFNKLLEQLPNVVFSPSNKLF